MQGSEWVHAWTTLAAEAAHTHREELIELDRAIGDGDHGENLDRGFTEVRKALDGAADDADAGALLKSTAMTLISKVGEPPVPCWARHSSECRAPPNPKWMATTLRR